MAIISRDYLQYLHLSYTGEDGEEVPFVLGNPNLPEELCRGFYESVVSWNGEIEGGFDAIKMLTPDEVAERHLEFKQELYPSIRGEKKAKNILDLIMSFDGDYVYENLESLNKFLLKQPVDSYVLIKILRMVIKQEAKGKALLAAKMRHIETYALKEQAIEYWRKHIDPKLSNPKAADLLIKIMPVSHRKLVDYVAEAKRENIHPAS
jgi:hypothetical protein